MKLGHAFCSRPQRTTVGWGSPSCMTPYSTSGKGKQVLMELLGGHKKMSLSSRHCFLLMPCLSRLNWLALRMALESSLWRQWLFSIDLKSGQVKKVHNDSGIRNVVPYMSLCLPGLGSVSTGEGPGQLVLQAHERHRLLVQGLPNQDLSESL